MGGNSDPPGILQKTEIKPYYQMVYAQTKIRPGELDNKILQDFERKSDHLIAGGRLELVMINKRKKRTYCIVDLSVLVDQRVTTKESQKVTKDNFLHLAWLLKKLRSFKKTKLAISPGAFGTISIGLKRGSGRVGHQRTNRDYWKYCTVKIGQNTEKSPGYLRRLAFTQTPVENNQLTLVWKTPKN